MRIDHFAYGLIAWLCATSAYAQNLPWVLPPTNGVQVDQAVNAVWNENDGSLRIYATNVGRMTTTTLTSASGVLPSGAIQAYRRAIRIAPTSDSAYRKARHVLQIDTPSDRLREQAAVFAGDLESHMAELTDSDVLHCG